MADLDSITVPTHLLPADGRFGSGPSRVRPAQMQALAEVGTSVMGTSHRKAPVKDLVRRVREGLTELFALPEGYEIVLGNGGSTAFWDSATFALVREKAQHLVLGEFSSKFAAETTAAPHLSDPSIVRAEPGSAARASVEEGVDVYAWPQNETSTGVMLPVERPNGAGDDQLVLVDATSAAGGVAVDLTQADAYYFAPQKSFASDGGLWIAALSPAAIARAEEIESSARWVPEFLSLTAAIDNSRKNQTLNTPAIATLVLLAEQIEWILAQGGLAWADARTRATSGLLQEWAARREEVSPFVTDPSARSQVVTTLDLVDDVYGAGIADLLRKHGIVDIEPYRKLGRNQLRIATFPSVPESDVQALIEVLDHVLDALRNDG
ncbi:phosphoserine transaminase [Brachybacterium endophyticum]|uniref:phosphoserine transaminase n=1 Tax=Brachybacterium endophyticum TaxID=2182385 RepID=UPI001F0CB951|nr:phosphoserine transaminase [Brachybacterium endophyticum]